MKEIIVNIFVLIFHGFEFIVEWCFILLLALVLISPLPIAIFIALKDGFTNDVAPMFFIACFYSIIVIGAILKAYKKN
jgi:hypothetical protein